MKIRRAITLLTYSFATVGCAATNGDALPYPTLNVNGNVLQSVCVPNELQGLKEQFARFKYKDEATAWKAITTLLCGGKTDENTRHIRNMMAEKLESTSDYTGQENQPETISASSEVAADLFALGVAYDASIANLPSGMFRVLYTTNKVCGESRTFKYDRNRWTIVGKGEACD